MKLKDLKYKISRKWTKLRLAPIRVFCFHQTSAVFNPDTMIEGDWTEIEQFKRNILTLQKEWTFISLTEAHSKLVQSLSPFAFRHNRYAVLTSDDGWASLKEILPWLIEQQIPITLFLNPCYMDGKHFREKETERYLSLEEVRYFVKESKGLITIGMHGWEHIPVSGMKEQEFRPYVEKTKNYMTDQPGFIPFWAYTWGWNTSLNDRILKDYGIIPIYMDGQKNYNDANGIHRELLDNYGL